MFAMVDYLSPPRRRVADPSREWLQFYEIENGTHEARGTSDCAFDSKISETRLRVVGVEDVR